MGAESGISLADFERVRARPWRETALRAAELRQRYYEIRQRVEMTGISPHLESFQPLYKKRVGSEQRIQISAFKILASFLMLALICFSSNEVSPIIELLGADLRELISRNKRDF